MHAHSRKEVAMTIQRTGQQREDCCLVTERLHERDDLLFLLPAVTSLSKKASYGATSAAETRTGLIDGRNALSFFDAQRNLGE